jgi:hypothetical protein
LRHLLQDLDAAQVVLDQVVVGREDARDLALGGEIGNLDLDLFEDGLRYKRLSSTTGMLSEFRFE